MAKEYTKQDMVRILKNDVEVPEIVNLKIDEAFKQVKQDAKQLKKKRRNLRWQAAAAVMGIMIIGTASVGAAGFFLWNPDVAEKFEADEVQQQELEIKKVTVPTPQEASCTNNGVTISLEQSLMTEKYMYLYFKITAPEDIKLPENTFFRNNELLLDGKPFEASYCGGLPELSEDGTDNVTYWEYFVELQEKTDINGKQITAHFENMEESDKADMGPMIAEGEWDVTWTIDYQPSEQVFAINQSIEEEDIAIKEVVISPISIEVAYDWAKKEVEETIIDENGNEEKARQLAEPKIYAAQYRMKDGSVEDISCGGMGSAGYMSEDENTYVVSFGCDKVYTVEDIESIIFMHAETEAAYEFKLQ